jgi:hypothetical protein
MVDSAVVEHLSHRVRAESSSLGNTLQLQLLGNDELSVAPNVFDR